MSNEEPMTEQPDLDAQLNDAAKRFDVELCKRLINDGASASKVFRTGANDWYDGNTTTALYNTIKTFSSSQEEKFVEVVVLLLANGADANFTAVRGNWNRVTRYPLFKEATSIIGSLSSMGLKKKFLLAFVDAGVKLNTSSRRGKQGNCGG
eukprot:UN26227